ncbi:MAG: DUF4239 domain-containing protein [Phycisphaerae bacterium]|nr:DUF4239 domain-containing protein [Phycisphaerae bacterium]
MFDFLRPPYASFVFGPLLAVCLLALSFVAHRFARRHGREAEESAKSFGLISGSVFALLGLLIAFTFSGAYSRYETRRQLIIEETNAIGTAFLRLDLLPESAQGAVRADFREYALNREHFIASLRDRDATIANLREGQALQNRIWSRAIAATDPAEYRQARLSVLPALNEMIDITTKRTAAAMAHPPMIVFLMLATVALACAWLTGYGAGNQVRLSRLYTVCFAAVTGFMLYVILDIEYPSFGVINLRTANEFLADLQKQM